MALSLLLPLGAALGGSALLGYLGATIAQNVAKYFLFHGEFQREKITISDLRDGDHIFVPGSSSAGLKMKGLVGYYHHAIYLGEIKGKKLVTDFGAVNKTRPVIRELADFVAGYSNQLYRRNYKVDSKIMAPEKSLEYARLICNGTGPWAAYSLNTNNCEQYATLLKMGQVYSAQAQHLPQDWFYRSTLYIDIPK